MKSPFASLIAWMLLVACAAAAEASPADSISNFRLKHGERHVTMDAALNHIALQQAEAMAAKDSLDHEVLGSFSSRIAASRAGRAAENIAYGYDSFDKTLDQWIASAEHRKNLLLHDASRVGIASARSAISHRTYWAMEIAGDYEPRPTVARVANRSVPPAAARRRPAALSCRLRILGVCF